LRSALEVCGVLFRHWDSTPKIRLTFRVQEGPCRLALRKMGGFTMRGFRMEERVHEKDQRAQETPCYLALRTMRGFSMQYMVQDEKGFRRRKRG